MIHLISFEIFTPDSYFNNMYVRRCVKSWGKIILQPVMHKAKQVLTLINHMLQGVMISWACLQCYHTSETASDDKQTNYRMPPLSA